MKSKNDGPYGRGPTRGFVLRLLTGYTWYFDSCYDHSNVVLFFIATGDTMIFDKKIFGQKRIWFEIFSIFPKIRHFGIISPPSIAQQ